MTAQAKLEQPSRYPETYARWKADPEGFWGEVAREIDWIRPADRVFDPSQGVYGRWFAGALCNTCQNAVDRHVAAGRGSEAAILYDSPVTGTKRAITYAELQEEVATLAAVLQDLGVEKGDRVILYMPMVPEAVFGMLACARIGAIHSVVFGGFAAKELATRIEDAQPKVILSSSCGIEVARVVPYKPLLDEAIDLASVKPETPRQRGAGPTACPSPRPTRSTSSTPPARPGGRRGSCATMAATWSR
jgi:propionyl-CoA synthetase